MFLIKSRIVASGLAFLLSRGEENKKSSPNTCYISFRKNSNVI